MLLDGGPGPVDDRAALVQEALARLERLLLVVQRAGELLDLASLLSRRFGRQPAQRLGDETRALSLRQRLALSLQPSHDLLVGGTDLLGGLDLLGAQLRQLRLAHRPRLRDQLVNLLGVAAVLGPQRLDFGDPPLVLGDDPLAALVRDAKERALELAAIRSRFLVRSWTPAVSSGAGAKAAAGAPVSDGPSRNAIRAWV